MNEYIIVFKSGVTETIKVHNLELSEHIGNVDIKDENNEDVDNFFLDLDEISAIIPREHSKNG